VQRHLLAMMNADKSNQYILTTHSPVFLDAGLAESVFRVDHDGDRSAITKCETTRDLYAALDALDIRASDILQATVVVWVEGPTDRMFIKRCLELRETEFSEGIHYQIVYYGGRLRSHLTFDDNVDDLVNLLRLSRRAVMMCDSDRDRDGAPLDKSKLRLQEGCERAGGLYWITAGREIENYLCEAVLTTTFRELLKDDQIKVPLGQFDSLAEHLRSLVANPAHGDKWKVNYEENKVRVMGEILNRLSSDDLDHLDLADNLNRLTEYIQDANSSTAG